MVILRSDKKGYTLIELMIVVSLIGIMASVGPDLYKQIRRFFFMGNTRIELQRDGRTVMSLMTRRIREAQSNTIVMNQNSGQPYYSRLAFTDIEGHQVIYSQSGKNLIMTVNGSSSTLTTNLRYLAFGFPRSDDMTILSVAMTLEKSLYEGQTKALHMASEKVRVMN